MYVLGEDKNANATEKRESQEWYPKVWALDQIHSVSFDLQWRTYSWKDVVDMTLEECQGEVQKLIKSYPEVETKYRS